jgi:hypothetical protein
MEEAMLKFFETVESFQLSMTMRLSNRIIKAKSSRPRIIIKENCNDAGFSAV